MTAGPDIARPRSRDDAPGGGTAPRPTMADLKPTMEWTGPLVGRRDRGGLCCSHLGSSPVIASCANQYAIKLPNSFESGVVPRHLHRNAEAPSRLPSSTPPCAPERRALRSGLNNFRLDQGGFMRRVDPPAASG
jgi:hypothetical protein